MKATMISASPVICEKIANKDCTILVKKSRPKIDTPFKCYIYCAQTKTIGDIILCKSEENAKLFGYNTVKGINKGFAENEDVKLKGKVIGEFICDRIDKFSVFENGTVQYWNYHDLEKSCLTYDEISNYVGKNKNGYAWHISNLVIYDTPKSLEMFPTGKIARDCGCGGYIVYDKILTRPPRSWCYVEDKEML